MRHILLAADGSAHSIRATEEAIKLAVTVSAKIILLYVMDEDKLQDVQDRHRYAEEKLHRPVELLEQANMEYSTVVLTGEPGPSIVHYVNEKLCDILVMGSRGLNSLQEMVLGSVSHKVAKRSKCPVVVVK